ncbi:DUF1993 domain-containing protein [Paradevosia shaoguanensis]|uniref:DUF1993 domain-containing protein n=1 Tax=Paradevosia shaoguanensis TaxID=1335043 RepID=UPI003C71583A
MTLSIYRASVPLYIRGFSQLAGIMDKAEANAAARKIDLSVLVNSRLAPDMYPFSGQIQRASDTAKGTIARLAGVEIPSFPDDEVTFEDLRARIAKTMDFIKSVPESAFDGADTREITLKLRDRDMTLSGADYLLDRQLPNFYFHITTAYAILRHNGVDIGKRDYLGV